MAHSRRNLLVSWGTRAVICVVVLAIGLGVFYQLVATRPRPKQKEDVGAAARIVNVMSASPVPVRRQWVGYGEAVAMNTADVSAEVAGIVSALGERDQREIVTGMEVPDGQLLVQLDATDYQLEVDSLRERINEIDALIAQLAVEEIAWTQRHALAQTEVRLAEADLNRVRDALSREGAKQRAVDQAEQVLAVRKAAEVDAKEKLDKIEPRRNELRSRQAAIREDLKVAERNVERCAISSPIGGVVAILDAEEGEKIAIGQRVARIVSLTRIEIPIQLPAAARYSLHVGDPIVLESTNSEPQRWESTITRIAPVDDENRTITVYAEHINDVRDPFPLPSGKFLKGTVTAGREETRSVIPRRLLDRGRVLVIADGIIRSRRAEVAYYIHDSIPQLSADDEEWAVLIEPLPPDTLVILSPMRNMFDGMPAAPKIVRPDSSVRSDADGERPSL